MTDRDLETLVAAAAHKIADGGPTVSGARVRLAVLAKLDPTQCMGDALRDACWREVNKALLVVRDDFVHGELREL
jgi:hypothetical protein